MTGLLCSALVSQSDVGAPRNVAVKTLACHHCIERPSVQISSWDTLCINTCSQGWASGGFSGFFPFSSWYEITSGWKYFPPKPTNQSDVYILWIVVLEKSALCLKIVPRDGLVNSVKVLILKRVRLSNKLCYFEKYFWTYCKHLIDAQ